MIADTQNQQNLNSFIDSRFSQYSNSLDNFPNIQYIL